MIEVKKKLSFGSYVFNRSCIRRISIKKNYGNRMNDGAKREGDCRKRKNNPSLERTAGAGFRLKEFAESPATVHVEENSLHSTDF